MSQRHGMGRVIDVSLNWGDKMSQRGLRSGLALAVVALSAYGLLASNSGALHAAPSQGTQKVRRAPPPVVSTVEPVPLTPRQIAQNALPSVVLLLTQDAEGQPLALGSGFFVRPGIIATNVHVIEGAARGWAKVVGQSTKYEIERTVGTDDERDLALLQVGNEAAPPLALGDSSQVSTGDPVLVVGNPRGLEGTLSQGIISAIRTIESDTFFQVTAPISPGSSGGPVLDGQGRVIGVAVATVTRGQNLNFAIPVSYLLSLAAHMNALRPLTSGKIQPRAGGLGGKAVEAIVGEQFVWGSGSDYGSFTFSIRNTLPQPVKNVECLVIFYGPEGRPVDTYERRYDVTIPAGLAKRVAGLADSSVVWLTGQYDSTIVSTRVKVPVLDFEIAESSGIQ